MSRNRLIASVALGCALYLGCFVQAFAAVVNWTHPTGGVQDGNAVSVSLAQIASTTVEWSNGATFGAVNGSQVVPAPAATVTLPDPAPGTSRCYRSRTTLVAAVGGLTSAPSNVSCKSVPAGPITPNPPTIVDVILAFLKRLFSRFA
jgi:hypothetical protein